MSKLPIIFLLLVLLVVPVNAAQYTLTGYQEFNVFDVQKQYYTGVSDISLNLLDEDKAVTLVHFKVPQDSVVSFTLYYGFGNTASGTATNVNNVSLWPLQSTTSTITFNGETRQYSYVDTNPEFDYYLSGYAVESITNQTGLIVYSSGYGSLDNDLAIFKPVTSMSTNLIYRVDISGTKPFDADISYGSKSEVAGTVSKSILDVANDWVQLALSIGAMLLDTAISLVYWLKFFFVDNLGMTVAIYIVWSLAFAARSCRGNAQKMLRTFFKDQKNLFEFIVSLYEKLVNIVSSFRGIFRI